MHGAGRYRHFGRVDEFGRAKWLSQTNDIGEFGRLSNEVERRHAGYRHDRETGNALAYLDDGVETAGSLQENVDDRDVECGPVELVEPGSLGRDSHHIEIMNPQHDGYHRPHIHLIIDDEHAAQRATHGTTPYGLQRNRRLGAKS